jgi:hypothetical protein
MLWDLGFYPRIVATKYTSAVTLRGLKEILAVNGFRLLKLYGGCEGGYEIIQNRVLRGMVAASDGLLSACLGLAVRIITVSAKNMS